jgi:hypothetical protein
MANVLTNLIPTVYQALDTVSRELVGFIPAVRRNTGIERAAKDQTIRFPIVPQGAAEDITPGQLPANSGSQTIGSDTLTINKSRAYPILWNGEEQRSVSAGSDNPMLDPILRDQFAQAFRTLTNEMETDLFATYVNASRAAGTAGTLPFGTADDLSDFANTLKELNINGAPTGDLHMILGNSSAANLRAKQSVLFKVNESGTEQMLRNGALGRVQGFMIGESNQVAAHTKGTGSGYVTNLGATLPAGSTDIILDTGTGTVVAGDVVTFVGDTNKYVVTTGIAAPGTITIAEPGLQQTLADGVAMTIGDSTNETNLAFDRNAIVLASRLPILPTFNGVTRDEALDRITVTDPFSGLSFDVAFYAQYHQVKIEVSIAWGVKMVKPEHSIQLLG